MNYSEIKDLVAPESINTFALTEFTESVLATTLGLCTASFIVIVITPIFGIFETLMNSDFVDYAE